MSEKIENALNESRILVLVAEVMVCFQYQAVFQAGFAKLPPFSQTLTLVGLCLLLAALILFISPATYHRIVEPGRLTDAFNRFITQVLTIALLPFALAVGIDFYIVAAKLYGRSAGVIGGAAGAAVAILLWYGLELAIAAHEGVQGRRANPMPDEETPLKERIKFVLMEARVILPGAQALLGFQFAAVLTERFDRLGGLDKAVHVASLGAVALSIILLMAPAAFHRIVEHGENSERLHAFSSAMVLASMAFLAIGISGDVFVVVQVVAKSAQQAWAASALTLLAFSSVWFGYMLFRRLGESGAPRHAPAATKT
ncbi:MAG TPA: DUF6328 family protein [Chthonomonadaceae bacterium]|nr:DUF6328 family protein [Chthonomonadaceae bacterium]